MRDGELLEKSSIDKIRHIPTVIVQGRYDMVCPFSTAYALKKVFPEAELIITQQCGHSAKEVDTARELKDAADRFRTL